MVSMPCPSCLASRSPLTELWLQNLRGHRLFAMRSVGLDSSTLRTSYAWHFRPLRPTFRSRCAVTSRLLGVIFGVTLQVGIPLLNFSARTIQDQETPSLLD